MVNNKIQEFLNDKFGNVRAVTKEDEIWFVAKDIAEILLYRDATDLCKGLDDDEKLLNPINTSGGVQRMLLVNKIGIQKALNKTRKITSNDKSCIYKKITGESIGFYGCKEIEFIKQLIDSLKPFGVKSVKLQHSCCNDKYKIDLYIPIFNVAIEYDENNHNSYSYEEQEGRQIEIEKELNCKFIRVNDNYSNTYNIGKVIRDIFNININKKYA